MRRDSPHVDAGDDVWQGTFTVPAGDWEYKAALQDSWTENYGGGGVQDGPNIPLSLAAETAVKFFYSHETHWITDNHNSVIATAAGDFQSELGCPGDWQPGCLRSWLQDPDGDGIYTFATDQLPAGDYEFKVALDEAWDDELRRRRRSGRRQHPVHGASGETVTFSFDAANHMPAVDVSTDADPVPGAEGLVQPALARAVHRRDPLLHDPRPVRRRRPGEQLRRLAGPCVPDDTQANVLTHGYLPSDKGYYHGGDLAGLTARLPYLEDLGITSIWVGPIFKNKPVQATAPTSTGTRPGTTATGSRTSSTSTRTSAPTPSSAPWSRMPTAAASRC